MLQLELASLLSRSSSFLIICSFSCAHAHVSVLFVNRIVNYSKNGQKVKCSSGFKGSSILPLIYVIILKNNDVQQNRVACRLES
jgi:hypothetical protein